MAELHKIISGSRKQDCDVGISQDLLPGRDCAGPRNLGLLRRRHHRYRGVVLIWVAIVVMVLILFVGLTIDTAKVCLISHQLQNAADAAALAGAQYVKFDEVTARQQAIDVAFENYADGLPVYLRDNLGNDPELDVVLGRYVRQSQLFIPATDPNAMNNAVKVVARRIEGLGDGPVPLIFGPIANVDTVNITRYAIAISSGSTGAGIITLAANPDWSHPSGLWIHGTGLIDVQGGDIQVNAEISSGSGHWQAMRLNGSLTINASEFNVVGTTSPDADDPAAWEGFYADPSLPPSVDTGQPRVEDPLAYLNPPIIPAGIATDPCTGYVYNDMITVQTIGTQGQTPPGQPDLKVLELYPGYYPGGINLNSGSWTSDEIISYEPNPDPVGAPIPIYKIYGVELRLNRGSSVETSLYALGGGTSGTSGLVIKGNASMYGEYVTLYVTGAHNEVDVEYGVLDVGGNGYIEVRPPGDFFLGDDGKPQINGQPGVSMWQDIENTNDARIIGTGDFNLSGTLYFPNNHTEIGGTGFQAGNQLIAGSLDLHGTGVIAIGYDGRNWVLGYKSYIVE